MQGLHGKVRNPASPSCWDNRDKPEESHQGAVEGGREGKLLVVDTEEGHELGHEKNILLIIQTFVNYPILQMSWKCYANLRH